MEQYIETIQEIWNSRDKLANLASKNKEAKELIDDVIDKLDQGIIRVCEYVDTKWVVNAWVKQAILLNFQLNHSKIYSDNITHWYDKIEPKFRNADTNSFEVSQIRAAPGSFIRRGAYIGRKVVLMPSFVNIGAYIDEGTMIDTWATIGSCAQIGKNCHISGGAGIGGVLEPIQNQPVIIEDQCFIGARSEIVEGVIVETGAVIGMGVFIGASTKIVDRITGEITYGRVPPYSVVVSGVLPDLDPTKPGLYCAVIIKQVDASTRSKTSINELLRG